MRKELENIYEDLFIDYEFDSRESFRMRPRRFRRMGEFDIEYSIVKIIRRELQRSEDSLIDKVKVRSDAKLFTLITFHQMVAIPLISEKKQVNIENLESYIEKDVKDLMEAAKEEKLYSDTREITAHTILSLLDKKWDSLNISRNEWWND